MLNHRSIHETKLDDLRQWLAGALGATYTVNHAGRTLDYGYRFTIFRDGHHARAVYFASELLDDLLTAAILTKLTQFALVDRIRVDDKSTLHLTTSGIVERDIKK